MCDSERIRQLLSVFVHNAISYTPSGGSIFLSAGLRKDGFSLSVADTGVGISYEDFPSWRIVFKKKLSFSPEAFAQHSVQERMTASGVRSSWEAEEIK